MPEISSSILSQYLWYNEIIIQVDKASVHILEFSEKYISYVFQFLVTMVLLKMVWIQDRIQQPTWNFLVSMATINRKMRISCQRKL